MQDSILSAETIAKIAQGIKKAVPLYAFPVWEYVREKSLFEKYNFQEEDVENLTAELHAIAGIDEETARQAIQEMSRRLNLDFSRFTYTQDLDGIWRFGVNLPVESVTEVLEAVPDFNLPFGLKWETEPRIIWLFNDVEIGQRVYSRFTQYFFNVHGSPLKTEKIGTKKLGGQSCDLVYFDDLEYGYLYTRGPRQVITEQDLTELKNIVAEEIQVQKQIENESDEEQENRRLKRLESLKKAAKEAAELPKKFDLPVLKKERSQAQNTIGQFPGILGMIYNYLMESAIKPDREFATAAAIMTTSLLINQGWQVQGINGNPLSCNLYFLISGESGSGKDYGRKFMKDLFRLLKKGIWISDHYKSFRGIENDLRGPDPVLNPRVWLSDEAGQFFESAKAKGSNQYTKDIIPGMLKLYTSSASIYSPSRGADIRKFQDDYTPIESPFFNFYGTTTPAVLYNAFSSEELETGFLGRVFIFPGGNQNTKEIAPLQWGSKIAEIPDVILAEAQAILDLGKNELGNPAKKPVFVTEEGKKVFDYLRQIINEENQKRPDANLFLSRCIENALKLSLIWAVAKNPENPVVDEFCARWGLFYAVTNYGIIYEIFKDHIADTPTERIYKKFKIFVKENSRIVKTDQGVFRGVDKTTACRGFFRKLQKPDLENLNRNIMEGQEFNIRLVKTAAKKETLYYELIEKKE